LSKNWGKLPKGLAYAFLGIGLGVAAAKWAPLGCLGQACAPVVGPVISQAPPRIDVVFALDATGSMGDEISVVKDKVAAMMSQIQSGNPKPDVRFGLVAYRDHGDAYVTKTYPLTANVQSIQASLQEVQAAGGGDTPEAVGEGLLASVEEMNWDQDAQTTRMIFLIGDAGPHDRHLYRQALQSAQKKQIQVNAWGCSGLQGGGQQEFQEIATLGGGQFQFLTYQQEVVKADGSRARLVFQGAETFEVKADEDWARGADAISEKRRVESSAVAAPGAAGSASYRSAEYRPSGSSMQNNLDTVLVNQVQAAARRKGVSY
jgi:uncharacterized protein YegL